MRQKEREAERRNNDRRLKHNRKQHRRTQILDVEKDRREIFDIRLEYQRKGSRRNNSERRD